MGRLLERISLHGLKLLKRTDAEALQAAGAGAAAGGSGAGKAGKSAAMAMAAGMHTNEWHIRLQGGLRLHAFIPKE
jgi:hypothetical protein